MRKIKLLHIQLLPLLSGAQNMMLNLLKGLDKNKYEIYVLSKPGGPLVEEVKKNNFHYIPVNSLRRNLSFWDVIAFISMIRIFRKYRFDIVHTHSSKTGFLGRIAGRFTRVPKIIHTVHGFPFHPYQNQIVYNFYFLLEKFAAKFCDKMVFVNNSYREFALRKRFKQTEKLQTIFNGIEIIDKKNITPVIIGNNSFTIGCVSRFEKVKNIEKTLKAAIRVCLTDNEIKFIFVGDGKLLSKSKEIVNKANMKKRIIFTGWQTNILEWLTSFDALLSYSKYEGLSISILEAMSVGLPIIASDINGNNELISEKNGVLIPLNDVDKLTNVLLSLPNRRTELEAWGKESLKLVRKKFNMTDFIDKYVEIYES